MLVQRRHVRWHSIIRETGWAGHEDAQNFGNFQRVERTV